MKNEKSQPGDVICFPHHESTEEATLDTGKTRRAHSLDGKMKDMQKTYLETLITSDNELLHSEGRERRIERIRSLVRDGKYDIPAGVLSQKIIEQYTI